MSKLAPVTWRRIVGWIAGLILALFIAFDIYLWLDVFVIQPEEYERLIGGESGCGKFKSYCSWPAFVLDRIPFTALSILSAVALLWPRLPKRELILVALVVAICGYLAWRVHSIRLEAELSGSCCGVEEDSA